MERTLQNLLIIADKIKTDEHRRKDVELHKRFDGRQNYTGKNREQIVK